MNYNIIANDYIRKRYFSTIKEYLLEKDIVNNKDIKIVYNKILKVINKECKQKQLIKNYIHSNFKAIKIVLNDNSYIIIHHATKKDYRYQLTYFINEEPFSHAEFNTVGDLEKRALQFYNYIDISIIK